MKRHCRSIDGATHHIVSPLIELLFLLDTVQRKLNATLEKNGPLLSNFSNLEKEVSMIKGENMKLYEKLSNFEQMQEEIR